MSAARRVALYNLKGSTGKTTLTAAVAAATARLGARVLVLDADEARDVTTLVAGWEGVAVRPWRQRLAADPGVALVLIDCPPDARKAAGPVADADLVVVPVEPEPLQVRRLAQVLGTLPPDKPYAVVVNGYYAGAGTDAMLNTLIETLGGRLWLPPIPRRTAFPRSQEMKIPPQEYRGRPVEVVEATASLAARMLTWAPTT